MKKITKCGFFLFFVGSFYFANAQVEFVESYYIDQYGNKVTGLIKDYGKEETPSKLIFKRNDSSPEKEIETNAVQEFQIGARNYKKFTVEIDKSPNTPPYFSKTQSPEYVTETLFLRTLSKGTASLYVFFEEELRIFFLQKGDETPIQLLKKIYQISARDFGTNNLYRQQLWNALKCEAITLSYVSRVKYSTSALNRLISKYNECQGDETENFNEKKSKSKFLFAAKAGVTHSSIELVFPFEDEFASKFSPNVGFEFEWFLPVRKNQWSVFINPNYHTYSGDDGNDPDHRVNSHSAFVITFGGRFHLYTGKGNSHFFVQVFLTQPDFSDDAFETDRVLAGNLRNLFFGGNSFRPGVGVGAYLGKRATIDLRIGDLGKGPSNANIFKYNYPFQTLNIGYVLFDNNK
ncbi:MAG: hypothetical protein AAFO69_13035 [Bacteroidota bacterium]